MQKGSVQLTADSDFYQLVTSQFPARGVPQSPIQTIIPRDSVLSYTPGTPGPKPKAQRLAAEKAAILAQAGKVKEESA
jgi:hypothetical protein